jgi:hypothetical protein
METGIKTPNRLPIILTMGKLPHYSRYVVFAKTARTTLRDACDENIR